MKKTEKIGLPPRRALLEGFLKEFEENNPNEDLAFKLNFFKKATF